MSMIIDQKPHSLSMDNWMYLVSVQPSTRFPSPSRSLPIEAMFEEFRLPIQTSDGAIRFQHYCTESFWWITALRICGDEQWALTSFWCNIDIQKEFVGTPTLHLGCDKPIRKCKLLKIMFTHLGWLSWSSDYIFVSLILNFEFLGNCFSSKEASFWEDERSISSTFIVYAEYTPSASKRGIAFIGNTGYQREHCRKGGEYERKWKIWQQMLWCVFSNFFLLVVTCQTFGYYFS